MRNRRPVYPAFDKRRLPAGDTSLEIAFGLEFGNLGAGEVDIVPAAGGVTGTFTRATTAWTKLSTGLWAQVASGVPRAFYGGLDTTVGDYLGYLAEGARTNEVLHSRDLTNAAWVKTTATAAKTQVGIDGAANSASSLTATAGNATALQVITEAAATRVFSAFVKRLVGTGEIDMTEDGGLTWTDVTASINSGTFTRVNAAAQSQLNPSVGFRIVTSGDSIAVDMCQNEAGSFASTPIPTTVAAVTRNADVLTYPTTGWLNASEGTLFLQGMVFSLSAQNVGFSLHDGTLNERMHISILATTGTTQYGALDGGVVQAAPTTANGTGANSTLKMAGAHKLNDFAAVLNGAAVATDTSGTLPTVTTAEIGNVNVATVPWFGPIRRVAYYPRRLVNPLLQQLTS